MHTPLLLSAFALIISIVSFFILRSYVKRRTSREWILQSSIVPEIREEINALTKTIDETTERDITLIEERGKRLRNLLREVDRRMALYIQEADKYQSAETITRALHEPPPQLPDPPRPATPGLVSTNETYVELGKLRYKKNKNTGQPVSAEPDEQAISAGPPESEPALPSVQKPLNEQIRSLVKEGLSAQVIAARLGVSVSEVEFISMLQQRRG